MHASAKDSGDTRDGTFTCPVAKGHPFFKTLGAQTTIQRWFADDVLNNNKIDRTLHSVYPRSLWTIESSTDRSLCWFGDRADWLRWKDPETGATMGTRALDGGPTSWQAVILETDRR